MNPESEFTRKRLTKFLCQELLYEYVTHNLEASREKEVTDYLETCRDSQRELDNLNKGLRFAMLAAQAEVSPKLFHALENFEPQWQKQLRAWTLWSSQRGWRMLPYVFVVLAVATGLLVTKPWSQKGREDVMLAEQLKKEPDMIAPASNEPVEAAQFTPAPAVLPAAEPAQPAAPQQPVYKPDVMESMVKEWLPAVRAFKPANLFVAAQVQAGDRKAQEAKAQEAAEKQQVAEADDSQQEVGGGTLFRASVQVSDFQNSWPAIRDKIVALGGKVAGNVELGWMRHENEAYFHFSLPESNMNELEIFLGTFGPVQFTKHPHVRVMPEGQIRIIMSVKDGMTHNESPPETP